MLYGGAGWGMGLLSDALLKPSWIDGAIEGVACWLAQPLMHPTPLLPSKG